MGVAVSAGVTAGGSTEVVGTGGSVSEGRGLSGKGVPGSVIGALVSVANTTCASGVTDGVAESAGAVQARAKARRMKSKIKERLLSGITSSAVDVFCSHKKY